MVIIIIPIESDYYHRKSVAWALVDLPRWPSAFASSFLATNKKRKTQ
jgi:hypothetical protein